MPFSSPAARAAFFEKLRQSNGAGLPPSQPHNPMQSNTMGQHAGMMPNINPHMTNIGQIKLPKVSNSQAAKPARFQKIQSFMKGS